MKIDFGASIYKEEGWVTVDIDTEYKPDVVHDMDVFPYPFPDSYADTIRCSHVLEHLKNPLLTISEFQRILKTDGLLILEFPHHSRNWAGCGVFPHSHVCSIPIDIMDFFPAFKTIRFRIEWVRSPSGKSLKFWTEVANNVISDFASLNPKIADRVWCYWVGGFDNVRIEAVKLENEVATAEIVRKRKEYHLHEVIA